MAESISIGSKEECGCGQNQRQACGFEQAIEQDSQIEIVTLDSQGWAGDLSAQYSACYGASD